MMQDFGVVLSSPFGLNLFWALSLQKYKEKIPKAIIIDPVTTTYKVALSMTSTPYGF